MSGTSKRSGSTDRTEKSKNRDAGSRTSREHRPTPISILEWIVAAIGLLLVLAVVAYLVMQSTREHDGSPMITVRQDSVIALGDGGHLVHFTAENRARTTAAAVAIVGELGDGPDAEARRATLDFLPGRSSKRGAMAFRRDPRGGVRLRVEGFQEP